MHPEMVPLSFVNEVQFMNITNNNKNILRLLANGPVIPAPRSIDDFKHALQHHPSPTVILLFGDINMLPNLLQQAKQYNKRVLVHFDLLGGIGKDRAAVTFLSRLGVTGAITTKPALVKYAREEGMLVIQRLFLMDSESMKTGIHLLKNYKPDALEVLPACIPSSVVSSLKQETGLPILGGGLLYTKEDVLQALKNGVCAVSTSRRELWDIKGEE